MRMSSYPARPKCCWLVSIHPLVHLVPIIRRLVGRSSCCSSKLNDVKFHYIRKGYFTTRASSQQPIWNVVLYVCAWVCVCMHAPVVFCRCSVFSILFYCVYILCYHIQHNHQQTCHFVQYLPREREREKRRQWTNKRTIVVSTKNECLNHFPFNEFQQVVVLYIPFGGGGHSLSPLFTISLIHKFSIQMYGWLSVVGFILAECFCYCQSKFRVPSSVVGWPGLIWLGLMLVAMCE